MCAGDNISFRDPWDVGNSEKMYYNGEEKKTVKTQRGIRDFTSKYRTRIYENILRYEYIIMSTKRIIIRNDKRKNQLKKIISNT